MQILFISGKPILRWTSLLLAFITVAGVSQPGWAAASLRDTQQNKPNSQDINGEEDFPKEPFVQTDPTVPNEELNFNDDTNKSCCAKNNCYKKANYYNLKNASKDFQVINPNYLEGLGATYVVECTNASHLPPLTPDEIGKMQKPQQPADIDSDGTFRSHRPNAFFQNDPARYTNGQPAASFHISAFGGNSTINLDHVAHYSICAARGSNHVNVHDTDNGSIITYQGNDTVHLAGNNTNMLTRTGEGDDTIEIELAEPYNDSADAPTFRGERWTGNKIYRTAISGAEGTDTLVFMNVPLGTKWCHIGSYYLFGERFHVVEIALPPSAVRGSRRQRVNIGESVEYVVFQDRKYTLQEFLTDKPLHQPVCEQPAPQAPPAPVKKKVIRGYW